MPRYIVKLSDEGKDYYLMWSTIVDAPIFVSDLEGFKDFYKNEYGNQGMLELEDRLKRVEEKGTSSFDHESAEDTCYFNNAGPGGSRLSLEEIIRFYCRKENCDEAHPCWNQRKTAERLLYDEKDGMDEEDFLKILRDFPYPKE